MKIQRFSHAICLIWFITLVMGLSSAVSANDSLNYMSSNSLSMHSQPDRGANLGHTKVFEPKSLHIAEQHSTTVHDQEAHCQEHPLGEHSLAVEKLKHVDTVSCHDIFQHAFQDCQHCSQLHCQVQMSFLHATSSAELSFPIIKPLTVYHSAYDQNDHAGFSQDILRPPKKLS